MSTSAHSHRRPTRLGLEALEDRTTPVFLPSGTGPIQFALGTPQPILPIPSGGESIALADIIPEPSFVASRNEYIVGSGPGIQSTVSLYDNSGGLITQFVPFAGFNGGVNVAAGDVLDDGAPEIVVAVASGGQAHVKVFRTDGTLLASFFAFTDGAGNPSYLGGLNIAVGNVLNEGAGTPDQGVGTGGFGGGSNSSFKSEIIVGSAGGGIQGHVKVFDGNGNEFRSFFPFAGGFFGGVSVAASSIDSTRTPGSSGGFGGGFGGGNRNRVRDTNSYAEVIVGATSSAPHVKVFSVWQNQPVTELQSYYAFDPSLNTGITVAAGSTDGIGIDSSGNFTGANRGAEIYAALIGNYATGAPIRVFNGENGVFRGQFLAFPTNYSRVVNIAVGNVVNFNSQDDDTFGNAFGNPSFYTRDLAIVAGDGPYGQTPRVFFGQEGSPAGFNGP